MAFGLESFLVLDAECEVLVAFAADKGFSLKAHSGDLLSLILVRVGVIQYSGESERVPESVYNLNCNYINYTFKRSDKAKFEGWYGIVNGGRDDK